MKIVIPTYQRSHRIHLNGGSLYALREVLDQVVLVVRPEEEHLYEVHGVELDVLPVTVKNIGQTRQYIWDKYSKSEDYFVMMDDDVQYFNQSLRVQDYRPGTFELKKPDQFWFCPRVETRTEITKMFKTLKGELERGTGMCSPRPNWTFPDGSDKNYPVRGSVFVTGFWCFNAKILRDKNLRFDNFNSCSDIDFLYQVLSLGIDCTYRMDYKYNIDLMCVSSELHTNEVQEYRDFMAKYPEYVKKRKSGKAYNYGFAEEGRGSLTYLRHKLLIDARNEKQNQVK